MTTVIHLNCTSDYPHVLDLIHHRIIVDVCILLLLNPVIFIRVNVNVDILILQSCDCNKLNYLPTGSLSMLLFYCISSLFNLTNI